MEKQIKALKITKGKMEFVLIPKVISYDQAKEILGVSEDISSSIRMLDNFFRFRCYHKDYINRNITFASAITANEKIDIPEECLFVLEDLDFNVALGDHENISINEVVTRAIMAHMGYYLDESSQKQPCIKW